MAELPPMAAAKWRVPHDGSEPSGSRQRYWEWLLHPGPIPEEGLVDERWDGLVGVEQKPRRRVLAVDQVCPTAALQATVVPEKTRDLL